MEQSIIQAITVEDNITKISIMEVPDKPGIAFGLFRKLSENDIKIESIVQNVNRININDITFTVNNDDAKKAEEIAVAFAKECGSGQVVSDSEVARLSVIGAAVVANTEVVTKFFKALYQVGVNIQMISTSDAKISCVIDKNKAKEALKEVYKEFGTV